MVRYQFMEIIVRLAHDQYIRTKQSTFLSDALQKLLKNDGLLAFIKSFENPQDWRDSRYWNRDCEKVLSNLITSYICLEFKS